MGAENQSLAAFFRVQNFSNGRIVGSTLFAFVENGLIFEFS